MTAFLSTLRRMNAADLLLPVGAALISAGLQQLGEREVRHRDRLRALAELVDDHRLTLEAAGVVLPPEVFGDEMHPLDIENAIATVLGRPAATPDYRIADNPNPVKPRRRGWKLAALALGTVTGIAFARREQIATLVRERVGGLDDLLGDDTATAARNSDGFCRYCGHPDTAHINGQHPYGRPTFGPYAPPAAPRNVYCSNCGDTRGGPIGHEIGECTWVNPPLTDEPVNDGLTEPEPGADLVDMHGCGWSGCDWTADDAVPEPAQAVAAALHRTKCTHRPGNAYVAG